MEWEIPGFPTGLSKFGNIRAYDSPSPTNGIDIRIPGLSSASCCTNVLPEILEDVRETNHPNDFFIPVPHSPQEFRCHKKIPKGDKPPNLIIGNIWGASKSGWQWCLLRTIPAPIIGPIPIVIPIPVGKTRRRSNYPSLCKVPLPIEKKDDSAQQSQINFSFESHELKSRTENSASIDMHNGKGSMIRTAEVVEYSPGAKSGSTSDIVGFGSPWSPLKQQPVKPQQPAKQPGGDGVPGGPKGPANWIEFYKFEGECHDFCKKIWFRLSREAKWAFRDYHAAAKAAVYTERIEEYYRCIKKHRVTCRTCWLPLRPAPVSGSPSLTIDPCPKTKAAADTAGWKSDSKIITRRYHGNNLCYRQPLRKGQTSGNQCCYEDYSPGGPLHDTSDEMGTVDLISSMSDLYGKSNALGRMMGVIGHFQADVVPFVNDPRRELAIQKCLRQYGVPSGTRKYGIPVTTAKSERFFHTSSHHCRLRAMLIKIFIEGR